MGDKTRDSEGYINFETQRDAVAQSSGGISGIEAKMRQISEEYSRDARLRQEALEAKAKLAADKTKG